MTSNSHTLCKLRDGFHPFLVSCSFVEFNLSPWKLHFICISEHFLKYIECANGIRECNISYNGKTFVFMQEELQWTAYSHRIINVKEPLSFFFKRLKIVFWNFLVLMVLHACTCTHLCTINVLTGSFTFLHWNKHIHGNTNNLHSANIWKTVAWIYYIEESLSLTDCTPESLWIPCEDSSSVIPGMMFLKV